MAAQVSLCTTLAFIDQIQQRLGVRALDRLGRLECDYQRSAAFELEIECLIRR
jgi:hypothetical protein